MSSHPEPYYFIGLMSGTSLDGIDAVLVDFRKSLPAVIGALHQPLPKQIRDELIDLCSPGDNEIERMGHCETALAHAFADTANRLIHKLGVTPEEITAIGNHGQTIRHMPNDDQPFTLQIGDPSIVACQTGICTVADFRRQDMAAGGQGAPLVPAFHAAVFASHSKNRAILNIGGMANLTLLSTNKSEPVIGFDTGPGNILIDAWHQQHHSTLYDDQGSWASSGTISEALLARMLDEPYLQLPPPKSTGRELFNARWLHQQLSHLKSCPKPEDVACTLVEYTARTITDQVIAHFSSCDEIYVCGGGFHNAYLMKRIAHMLPNQTISTTAVLGVEPDWVEAAAFAWLAKQRIEGKTGNLPSVTGASKACILGGIYK
jgi:anhydro-N-acetylmuramic acid kinase